MKFQSYNGANYWFNNSLGMSFPLDIISEEKNLANQKDNQKERDHSTELIDDYKTHYGKKLEKIEKKLFKSRQLKISKDIIKKQILREGLLQLTLCVTEACNLACRYCCYSEAYPHNRNATQKKMVFKTAKKALDYYFTLIEEGQRYNPHRTPTIGFYGGEPLLNFELISQCVSYIEKEYPKIKPLFTLTTNGTLLDGKKCDFFMSHNFSIAVSIDGPEKEHNRNRVYQDGTGTFTDVINNIKPFIDAGYTRCHTLCVFDWKSDLFALQEFFNRKDIPQLSMASMPNQNDGCTYYEQFSQEERLHFRKLEANAFREYIQNLEKVGYTGSFFDQLYGLQASRTLYIVPTLFDTQTSMIPYTNTCWPGRKIFVDVEGNFHICERINHTIPIGNVDIGLNFEYIMDLVNDYNSHLDQCPACSVQKLCGECYCAFVNEGKIQYASQVCSKPVENRRELLKIAFTIAEINPDLPGTFIDQYYSWLSELSPTMGD